MQARLEAISPDYPAPPRDLLSLDEESGIPLRLIGVDLIQGDRAASGDEPEISGEQVLTVKTYWCPTSRLKSSLPVSARFADPHGFVSKEFSFRVGPSSGDAWLPETVHTQSYDVDMRDVALAITGECCLTINVQAGPRLRSLAVPLQLLRFRLVPRVRPAPLPPNLLQEHLQPPFRAIPFRVRLGRGAATRAEVPEQWRSGNRQLAVVSTVLYESVPQGEPVCDVVFTDTSGREAVAYLRSGVATARNDHDYFAEEAINHETPPVFDSVESDYLNQQGQPFQRHTYIGRIEIPKNLGDLASVEFRCSRSLIVDIYGIALVAQ